MEILKKWLGAGLAILLLIGNVCVWSIVLAETRNGKLSVSFLDVGQGDAILVVSPTGRIVLIDSGPDSAVLPSLGHELSFFQRKIDLIITTHDDVDHIGGLPYLDGRYNSGTTTTRLRAGEEIDLGNGAILKILSPLTKGEERRGNEESVVALLSYGQNSFLFTGDAPKGVENFLTSQMGNSLHAQVLKVGHHGSDTSTSDSFLYAVAPYYAVIMSGEGNKFGHPHQATLELLNKHNSTILNTATLGTIKFESNGETVCLISPRDALMPSDNGCRF